ncbi:MAG: response regulator [Alphaproteobacteria bacterium]|nr:response regulator [Alphaproteobacteria bacterium]
MTEIAHTTLPFDAAAAPVQPAVLLVDDDRRNLFAVSEVLSGLGAEVVCARSGKEALRLVLRRQFCAILMDVRMPEMNGYETAEIIRQRQRSRRIPIIFLTAYDKDEAHVFRGYSTGAVDYVFKPVEPVILRAKVSVFIELQKQADEIRFRAEQERLLLEENLRIRGERMNAEHQLRSTEKREATIIRSLPIAVYEAECAEHGMVRTFLHNDSVKRLLGFDSADFVSDTGLWSGRIHPQDRTGVLEALTDLAPGDNYAVEYRWRCCDDVHRYFLDQGVAMTAEGSDRLRIFGTMFDVNDRRTLEQQLVHAQKMDAVGRLTGGIAHDFNNMLMVIIGNLDSLRRAKGLETRTARRVEHALQGALHCRDMTKRLLGFSRQQSLSPKFMDLTALIHSLGDLLTRTLGERIEIRKKLAADLWQVYVDQGQIEAALLNLLVNARDAMPGGGRVSLTTANVEICKHPSRRPTDLPVGHYVMLEIADNGIGMPEEVLKRAGEAFFTTKAKGHGTGLGLSTIHGFVKQSRGSLEIDSTVGRGTAVRIFLPRYERAVPRPTDDAARSEPAELPCARDHEVVLVVEDEDAVRQTAVNVLRELGYRVIEAANAAAAREALEHAEDVRLLFTDIIMPGAINGYQLAIEAQHRQPELSVLFTSGYGGDVIAEIGEDNLEPFLRKPYRDFELARAVRNALG